MVTHKNLFRSLLISAIFASQRLMRPLVPPTDGIRILTYHGINDNLADSLSVSPEAFDEQMNYLARCGYRIISLDEYYEYRRNGIAPSIPTSIIVLHDGYTDNFTHAFPILRKYGFTATVFLTTGFVGQTFEGKHMLSWTEVKEMSSLGITFGSHTVTHPFLTKVPLKKAEREISESKLMIEEMLGQNVTSFCYPYGDINGLIKKIVEDVGYRGACTISPGVNTACTDLFTLRTTEISPKDTLFDFKKKLAGAYDPLHWLMQLLLKDRFPALFYGHEVIKYREP